MKQLKWIAAAGAFVFAMPSMAEQVTFTKDVLPILQENCQNCHRPSGQNMSGMIAPMSLMTYQEVRPWSKAISRAVADRVMPPWHASEAQYGKFKNERTLTQEQIDTLVAWVDQGAKRGNPSDAPAPVEFQEGWMMGEPDMVLQFPEPFFVEDEVQDLYQNITVEITEDILPKDMWVTEVEFQPGSEVVHHIIAYASAPGQRQLGENEDIESDREALRSRKMIGGLAPGTDPGYYPEGFAFPLQKGSSMTFAMHYHKEPGPGTGMWDNSIMAMKLTDQKPAHELTITNMAHGAFEIPPNHPRWMVSAAETFNEDIYLINLFPHMHLRGSYSKYTAFYPDGSSEVLLETPEYDFNWQEYYYFHEPKLIPAGTRIEYEMAYDNSPENAEASGFNSNRAVRFGGPTTDEMDLGWYTFAPAAPEQSTD